MTGPRGDTRKRVLDTALTLFAAKTVGGTTLQDIADAMGVTKAALYYYFHTKDEILAALTDAHLTALEDVAARAEKLPPGPRAARELLSGTADVIAHDPRGPAILMFDRTVPPQSPTGKRMAAWYVRMCQTLVTAVPGRDPDAPTPRLPAPSEAEPDDVKALFTDPVGTVRATSAIAALFVPLIYIDAFPDRTQLVAPAVAAACAALGIRAPRAQTRRPRD